ncbi:MAG TPA: hypothetical protein VNK52_07360 [Hyphomicrobiaceae bacterium]|nr:hypothetical protein [Hyphomicrobiaceae bacterium]
MSVISRINTQQARYNPEAVFDGPEQLLEEVALTRGQKLAALEQWAKSIALRLDATAEGMPPSGRESDEAELLRRVRLAEDKLLAQSSALS